MVRLSWLVVLAPFFSPLQGHSKHASAERKRHKQTGKGKGKRQRQSRENTQRTCGLWDHSLCLLVVVRLNARRHSFSEGVGRHRVQSTKLTLIFVVILNNHSLLLLALRLLLLLSDIFLLQFLDLPCSNSKAVSVLLVFDFVLFVLLVVIETIAILRAVGQERVGTRGDLSCRCQGTNVLEFDA